MTIREFNLDTTESLKELKQNIFGSSWTTRCCNGMCSLGYESHQTLCNKETLEFVQLLFFCAYFLRIYIQNAPCRRRTLMIRVR